VSGEGGDGSPFRLTGPTAPAGTDAAGTDAVGTDAVGTDAAGTDAAGQRAGDTGAAAGRRTGGRNGVGTLGPTRAAGPSGQRHEREAGWSTDLRRFARAVVVVLPVWVAARVLVVGALAVARATVSTLRPHNAAAALRVRQGLLAWDGGWYESIARHGYQASGVQSVRFYPGYPMVARVLGWIPGIGVGPALVILSNLCALAAMATLVVLVRHDLGDDGLARRSAWLIGLAPSAYALVLGYSDASLLLCSVVTFLGARTGRWWWAAVAGLAGSLVRPVGLLLVVPVAVELWRQRRTATAGAEWVARLSALVAPLVGTVAFFAWVGSQFGDPWLPLRVQDQQGHRGGLTVPLASMAHDLESAVHGHHLGSALHLPWVAVCLVLLVVAFRRLPLSYGAFAATLLVVSLASSNLDSFERYALGAFPLAVAASTATSRRGVEAAVLVVSAAGMTAYAVLAFVGIVVP
jgi:hypothetical protein